MDDEANLGRAGADGLEDAVEGHHDVVESLGGGVEPKLQREEGAGHRAGHGDRLRGDFGLGELALCHQHRAVAVAHARAAGQQGILVAHVGLGMDADGGDVQFAPRGALVQRLDVLQDMLELESPAVGISFRAKA